MTSETKIRGAILAAALAGALAAGGCAATHGDGKVPEGVDTSYRVDELVGQAEEALLGITGPDQARVAQDVLIGVNADLEAIIASVPQMSPTTRREVAETAAEGLVRLENASDRAFGIAGVEERVGPAVVQLSRNLQRLD